jgi:hypothetical protein
MLTIQPAFGQPFIGAGAIGFEPEISTVSSGTVVDVQPTVSNDLKYVTFSTRAQNSQLLALRQFAFTSGVGQQGPPLGFVGTVSFSPQLPANANVSVSSNVNPNSNITPDDVERRAIAARSILSRKGMFLLRVN